MKALLARELYHVMAEHKLRDILLSRLCNFALPLLIVGVRAWPDMVLAAVFTVFVGRPDLAPIWLRNACVVRMRYLPFCLKVLPPTLLLGGEPMRGRNS